MSRKDSVLRVRWNKATQKNELVLLEEHVVQEIVDRLWLQAKIRVNRIRERIPGVGIPSTPGLPDLMGHIPQIVEAWTVDGKVKWSVPLYIEVKRPGGARRIAQTRFIEEARKDGCAAFFAESWLDVIRELYSFGIKLSA
jgi:hypothetical protein